MDVLVGFLLATLALAGSPGPNTLSLAAVGSGFGGVRGMPYMAGLTLGMALVIGLCASGVSAVVIALPGLASVIFGAAAVYFLWLAWRIATAPPLGQARGPDHAPRWPEGVVISLMNPKAYAAMSAMFAAPALTVLSPWGEAMTKAVLLWGVIWVVNYCWLATGAALNPLFRNPATSRAINICFAVALLLSGGLSLLGQIRA